nr:PREDICTED: uncharacterized protein LOC103314352 [Tribolium castaneum]|eukprot:XP_008198404.1 PREDICTED: uncharacterized protein LOC103314352 [Tribolium castaneum]
MEKTVSWWLTQREKQIFMGHKITQVQVKTIQFKVANAINFSLSSVEMKVMLILLGLAPVLCPSEGFRCIRCYASCPLRTVYDECTDYCYILKFRNEVYKGCAPFEQNRIITFDKFDDLVRKNGGYQSIKYCRTDGCNVG